jgi:hypothetical protein
MNNPAQPIMFFLNDDYLLANKQSLSGYNYIPSLIIDRDHLLPFQIIRTDTSGGGSPVPLNFTSVKLYERNAPVTKYTELLSYLSFKRYNTITDGGINKVNVYDGTSIIPPIPQGIYYLVITDDRSPVNTWTSSQFISSFPRYKLLFEYSHPKSINYLVQPVTYKIQVVSKTVNSGEVNELIEKYPDIDGNETIAYYKQDVIHSCTFFADKYMFDAISFMKMFKTIYLTTETGYRSIIQIYSIEATPIAESNHFGVVLRYTIPEEQLININETPFLLSDIQKGTSYVSDDELLRSDGKIVATHGKRIKRRR